MKNEYIIINKTTFQKRIEELEKEIEFYDKVGALSINPNKVKAETELSLLKELLSQSTPLIAVLEQAFGLGAANNAVGKPLLSDYISNLKLDI